MSYNLTIKLKIKNFHIENYFCRNTWLLLRQEKISLSIFECSDIYNVFQTMWNLMTPTTENCFIHSEFRRFTCNKNRIEPTLSEIFKNLSTVLDISFFLTSRCLSTRRQLRHSINRQQYRGNIACQVNCEMMRVLTKMKILMKIMSFYHNHIYAFIVEPCSHTFKI